MARYLWKVWYTPDGVKGLLKEGGTSRRAVVEKLLESVGGKLELFYFAFGDVDAYCVAEIPSHVSTAAVSLTVGASGAVKLETIPLLTCEELDAASKQSVDWRPPG